MKKFYFFLFQLLLIPFIYSQNSCPGVASFDYSGKTYHTVQIGTQCWLKENLDLGTRINGTVTQANNSITEKYCYNDSDANCATYGALFQWNEAMQYVATPGAEGICQAGWHIPTRAEFAALASYVKGNSSSLLASGSNTNNFTALFGGYRDSSGVFKAKGSHATFWTSTPYFYYYDMNSADTAITYDTYISKYGLSVRCIMDSLPKVAPQTPAIGTIDVPMPPTITWAEFTGAASFQLQVSVNSSFNPLVFNDSTLTTMSKQIPGLSILTQYYWRVRAKNSRGWSDWTATGSFTTAGVPPDKVSLKSPLNNALEVSQMPVLNWSQSSAALTYRLQVATTTSFTTGIAYDDSTITSTSKQIYALPAGTLYHWRVIAKNKYGLSDWSDTHDFTTVAEGMPCEGLPTVTYAGRTYNTVQIGSQCWLKQNLNVGTMIDSSQNQTITNTAIEKYCYQNDTLNCGRYGGLYQWSEAMGYVTTAGAQGICPTGWHLPRLEEWDTLKAFVGGDGNALKADGSNTSGFSAIFAGARTDAGAFTNFGSNATFWSTTRFFYYTDLNKTNGSIYENTYTANYGLSIRCIKAILSVPVLQSPSNGALNVDLPPTLTWTEANNATSYSLQIATDDLFNTIVFNDSNLTGYSKQVSNLQINTKYYWRLKGVNTNGVSPWTNVWSFTTGSRSACKGMPTITYEGKTYNTIQIGNQCWLKENLNVGTVLLKTQVDTNNGIIEKYCMNDNEAGCETYGAWYGWAEAVQYANGTTNTTLANPPITGLVRGICPQGWHIPSTNDFTKLTTYVGKDINKLLAVGQGAGNDATGFSAILAGGYYGHGQIVGIDSWAEIISSSEEVATTNFCLLLISTSGIIYQGASKVEPKSVRCVLDTLGTVTESNDNISLIKEFQLSQNYPNPFNPSTTISYALPERSKVVLSIYNLLGQKILELFNGEKAAGSHSFVWNASTMPSGIYFYELKTDKYREIKKLILLK